MYKPGAGISIHALLAESDSAAPKTRRARSPFLSTLSLRRATPTTGILGFNPLFLSTLSLRRATNQCKIDEQCCSISIHALLAESDRPPGLLHSWRCYFYPRSPCGERRTTLSKPSLLLGISIHALLAESDCVSLLFFNSAKLFLSTLSLRRATATPARDKGPSTYFYPRSPCGERPDSLF